MLFSFEFFFHFFFILLLCFINERLHKTLSVLAESAIKHILVDIILLYGFESVFCQVLIEFLFVVYLLFFFVTASKIEYQQFSIPSTEALVIVHIWDILVDFQWFFITLKLIV